jgi:hypothetical protein
MKELHFCLSPALSCISIEIVFFRQRSAVGWYQFCVIKKEKLKYQSEIKSSKNHQDGEAI